MEKRLVQQKGSNLIQQNYITEEGLDIVNKHINLFKKFIQSQMEQGIDYGYITDKTGNPISDKPILFKSGAEKLAMLFSFSPTYEIDKFEDWDKGIFRYEVKCTLISRKTGEVIAEGNGICHSKEKKYRNVNPFDLPNTLLKMAKKRAFVDAILLATGGSFFFTQDLEDMQEEKTTKPQEQPNTPDVISEPQRKRLFAIAKKNGLSNEDIKETLKVFGYESTKDIKKKDYEDIINSIENQAEQVDIS